MIFLLFSNVQSNFRDYFIEQEATICNSTPVSLSCPKYEGSPAVLEIRSVVILMDLNQRCSPASCHVQPLNEATVRQKCQGRSGCEISACPGPGKLANITYICIPRKRILICFKIVISTASLLIFLLRLLVLSSSSALQFSSFSFSFSSFSSTFSCSFYFCSYCFRFFY